MHGEFGSAEKMTFGAVIHPQFGGFGR